MVPLGGMGVVGACWLDWVASRWAGWVLELEMSRSLVALVEWREVKCSEF